MKLSQYKEKKNSKKIIIIIGAILLFVSGIIVDRTFANFKVQKSFKIMEGNFIYEGSGEIIFAFYKDNKQVNEIPKEEEFYNFEKGICTNNATVVWNSKIKKALISDLTTTGTKCDLYFVKNQSKEYFGNLQKSKPTELVYDETSDNNLRFIGANPNNYVAFNNETWRIIGVMNNIEDEENEILKSHIKIIRDSIGEYSWDSTSGTYPNGINEWSTAAIAKVLNENYYNKKAGGTCYGSQNKYVIDCPRWESIGLNDDARAMVSKIKWEIGGSSYGGTMEVYKNEQNGIFEKCKNVTSFPNADCNDEVPRTTSWTGYVGLPYASDLGFATSGSLDLTREECMKSMAYWGSVRDNSCYLYSWLAMRTQWTMTPMNDWYGYGVLYKEDLSTWQDVTQGYAYTKGMITPVVYLNSDVKIEEDTSEDYGSSSNPFRIAF